MFSTQTAQLILTYEPAIIVCLGCLAHIVFQIATVKDSQLK